MLFYQIFKTPYPHSRLVKGVKLYFIRNYESYFSYATYFNPSPTLPLRRGGLINWSPF